MSSSQRVRSRILTPLPHSQESGLQPSSVGVTDAEDALIISAVPGGLLWQQERLCPIAPRLTSGNRARPGSAAPPTP